MQTRIRTWGNGLGIWIPRSFAAETQIAEGLTVELSLENGCLRIRPRPAQKYTLSELLKGVRRSNLHSESWSLVDPDREVR